MLLTLKSRPSSATEVAMTTPLKLLEDNMNAKVIGVRENIAELLEKSPRPEEVSGSEG